MRGCTTSKNIEVEIPHDKLVVVTGLSGSGKSTLAFDTIFAEGQRRYVESLSAYARQFLGQDQQARRGHHHGHRAGHRHRTEGQHAQSPFDGGYHDRNIRLPEAALRPHRAHLFARVGAGGALLQRGRRGGLHPTAGRGRPRRDRGAAHAGQGAGDHRETHAAALRRPDARLDEGRNAAHRGYPAPGRSKRPGRRRSSWS